MDRQKIFYIFIVLLLVAGCSTNNENLGDDLAVQIVNSGSEELKIKINSTSDISFCYKERGCIASVLTQIRTLNPGSENLIVDSNPNFEVTGVEVEFVVLSGTGRVEILRGESGGTGGVSFSYDSDNAVVYSTDPFSAGSSVRFKYGDTD